MWFHFSSFEWISPFMTYRRTPNHDPNQYLLNNSITAGRPLFSCAQAALWMVQSVWLSVRPSLTPFSLCSHHCFIMKFSGVITMPKMMSMQKIKSEVRGQGHRDQTQFIRSRTVTPVRMHRWWWNHAQSLCFSRSSVKFQGHTGQKIAVYEPNWEFPDCNSSLNAPMALKWCTKLNIV